MTYNDFINSTEHQRIYDEVVSLGFNCHISSALRQLSLQHKTYPLDWGRVVEEDTKDEFGFRRKIEFLCTDFKDFINEEDLYIHDDMAHRPEEENMSVFNRFNGMHFNHDFPKGKTLDESYPFVKEKYDRRIKRLIDLINSNKKICFVFYAGLGQLPKAEIIYCVEIFKKMHPNANVDFLFLQNDVNIGDDIVYEEISESVRHVSFYNHPFEYEYQGYFEYIGTKLKEVIHACIKKEHFEAPELSSNFCVDGVISNPTPDFNGIVSFGPYTPMYSGNHTVTVNYKLTKNYRAFVDIACDKGTIAVQKIELPHNQKQFKFDFTLDKNVVDLEVRFYCEQMEHVDENNKFKLFGIRVD